MHESHRAHLEFALDQGETVIFDEATYLEQKNMLLLLRDQETTHITGQYDFEGRLNVTNNLAQGRAQRLAEVRQELNELIGKPQLTIIKGGKN